MTRARTFVIVGAGLAGAKAAEALRIRGYDDRLIMAGAEHHVPYERPPLSKGYLMGSAERDSVFVHPAGWYDEHSVEFRPGTRAVFLDRAGHRIEFDDGSGVGYDRLMLATGASPRSLDVPGAQAPGVYRLRTLDDSDRLIELLSRVERLAIVGAGWIGLEVAAAARTRGVAVTIVESARLPLLRVLGPEIAGSFAALHRDHGVDLRLDATITEVLTVDGVASGLRLTDGTEIDADAVLIAVGAEPNTQLARTAGLTVDNGVVVNAALRTSDPDIVAAGDVANAYHPLLDRHIRVEHWANALNQPDVAAATMLGEAASYARLPYFYTDQYDLGMEYVGHADPGSYDRVVIRGDLDAREYIAFWLGDGRVLAGMNVNIWDVVDPVKALIESGHRVEPDRLADPGVPLTEI